MTSLLSRRGFLAGSAAAALSPSPVRADEDLPPLREYAAKRGLFYGCAVHNNFLFKDPPFNAAVAREANMLVHSGGLKWPDLRPAPDRFDFSHADPVVAFAAQHGMKMRGHTLCWYAVNPPWVEEQLATNPNERILTDHIEKVVGYYRGRMHSWDVVNEAIDPTEGSPDGLRVNSPWYKAFGPEHIEIAFHAARQADPKALLFYNEYGIESTSWADNRKRRALLMLCGKLRKKRVPIDAIGLQAHLRAFRDTFDEKTFARFLADIRALGFKIMVTELDVADIGGPADIAKRDAEVASLTRRFLDVVFDSRVCLGVLTWGLSDRYSWLSEPAGGYAWPDGQLSRGLPLDENLKRKPMWHAIAKALGA